MRYRYLSYRYTVTAPGTSWSFGDVWERERLRGLLRDRWRPDADVYETESAVEVVVDLAGVDEDDFEILLFEDTLVVEGRREPASRAADATYYAVGIRQGPFRVELPLPAVVDARHVQARYDRGLLLVTLPKRASR